MSGAQSGVGVNEECGAKFLELKRKNKFKFITFKIDDSGKTIVLDKDGPPNATLDDLIKVLPESDCRYGVFDYHYKDKEGCEKTKIFFVSWAPDVARVKSKMLYASSKDRFKRELDGVHLEIQATDLSEIDESAFAAKCTQVGQS